MTEVIINSQKLTEIIRFGLGSLIVLIVKIVLTSLLAEYTSATLAYALTHLAIFFLSYFVHLRSTFQQEHTAKRMWAFFKAVIFVKVLDFVIFSIVLDKFQISSAVVFATVCMTVFRYLVIRRGLGQNSNDEKISESGTVFYDGDCSLCNGFVQFVIDRDPEVKFHFATLGGVTAKEFNIAEGAPPAPRGGSIYFYSKRSKRVLDQSSAVLTVISELKSPWPFCSLLFILPRFFRDTVYKVVARYRRQLFGNKNNYCSSNSANEQRFLK